MERHRLRAGADSRVLLTPWAILGVAFMLLSGVDSGNVWSRMYPLGEKGVHSGYGPHGRHGHSAVTNDERVIVFGGRSMFQNGDYLNDMWLYDWNTGNWSSYLPNELVCDECSVCSSVLANEPEGHEFIRTSSGVYIKCDPENPDDWQEAQQAAEAAGDTAPGGSCAHHMTCYDWTGLRPFSEPINPQGTDFTSRASPSGRYHHGAALVQNSQTKERTIMVMFGGYGVDCTDYCWDTWHYDIVQNLWKKIPDSTFLTARPARRWKMGMTDYKDMLLMFGGHGMRREYTPTCLEDYPEEECDVAGAPYDPLSPRYYDDLWAYNATELKWERLFPTCVTCTDDSREVDGTQELDEDGPRGRHSPSLVTFRDSVLMFGGYAFGGVSTFVGKYPTQENTPGAYPSLTAKYYLDDLWKYNITENTWAQIKPLDPPYDAKPAARYGHGGILSQKDGHNIMLVSGGVTWDDEVGDLWQFNLTSSAWLKVTGEGEFPSRRGDSRLVSVGARSAGSEGRALLIGGLGCLAGESYFIATHDPEETVLRNPNFNDLPVSNPNKQGEKYCIEYLDDLWQYYPTSCPRDCSRHGTCEFNVCICEEGFAGIDCALGACRAVCTFDYVGRTQNCDFCSGRGICNGLDDSCECTFPAIGVNCGETACINDCTGNGKCDVTLQNSEGFGTCVCNQKSVAGVAEDAYDGLACEIALCPKQPSGEGTCNNRGTCVAGECICYPGYGDSIWHEEGPHPADPDKTIRIPVDPVTGATYVSEGLFEIDQDGKVLWSRPPEVIKDCGDILFVFAGATGGGPTLGAMLLLAAALWLAHAS